MFSHFTFVGRLSAKHKTERVIWKFKDPQLGVVSGVAMTVEEAKVDCRRALNRRRERFAAMDAEFDRERLCNFSEERMA